MDKSISPYVIEKAVGSAPINLYSTQAVRDDESAGIGIFDCWKIIRAKRRLLIGFLMVAMFLTTIVLLLLTPQYRAKATLMIAPEAPHLMDANNLLQQMQGPGQDDYEKTQYSLLQSDQLIAQVIVDLKLGNKPPIGGARKPASYASFFRPSFWLGNNDRPERLGVSQQALDAYHSRLKVAAVSGTRLVEVSFLSPDPELSADIVNTHVREYLTLNGMLQARSSDASKQFLEHELIEIRTKVEKSEAALNAYRSRMGILSFGVQDRAKNAIAEQTMVQLNRELSDAAGGRIASGAEMQLVQSGDYNSLPEVINNQMIENLQPQVDRLQAEYAELSAKYTPAYPAVSQLKAKLDEARSRLNADIGAIARAVERRYQASVSREKALEEKIAEEKKRDFAMNDASLQDAILAREVDTNREIYRDVLKRIQEISVNGAAPLSNITLVESAVPPAIPSSPKKLRDLAISGILSLFAALGLIFLTEQLDDRLKSGEEIESYLHLPELAVVPDFSSHVLDKPGIQRFLPKSRIESGIRGLLSTTDAQNKSKEARSRLIAEVRPKAVMEAFRSIRTALLYSRAGGAPRSVLFISAVPGEGKTTTSCGTAWAFAQTGARTLLIDADLREPRCHQVLKTEKSLGLSEVLVGLAEPSEVIQRLDRGRFRTQEDLHFLSAGTQVPNPGELLTSMKMFEVLQQLSLEYQFVLLDSAPIGYASDTIGLATMVDSVIVVAGAATSKQRVRAVCRKLSDAGATIAGVVANWADPSRLHGDIGRYYGKSSYSNGQSQVDAGSPEA